MFVFNIVFTVHLVYIKNQDQLDAQSLLKTPEDGQVPDRNMSGLM
jgi:hypothetical protein